MKEYQKNPNSTYYTVFILISIFLIGILNYAVIQKIVIPDPCRFHNAETSTLFQLFYTQTPANGDHPEPSIFNFIGTLSIAVVIGILTTKKYINTKA